MSIDLSGPIQDLLRKELTRAEIYLRNDKYKEAAESYLKAAELSDKLQKYALTPQQRTKRAQLANQYRELAEKLTNGELVKIQNGESSAEKSQISSDISKLIHVSNVTWADIGGLEDTKKEIKYAYGLALAKVKPGVMMGKLSNILFYGPPGTGKTLLAAATSNGIDAVFFNVKVSNILSKYFGESTKIFSGLYDAARRAAPSVIFLDEFESLTAPRGASSETGPERRLLSTILAELDGLAEKGSDRHVLTIAATNAPWSIDEAVLSRFHRKIYIPLPDFEARKKIFEIHLKKHGFETEVNYDWLAERTRRFSGREIEQICGKTIERMIGEMNMNIPSIVDQGKDAIRNYEIVLRPLTRKDFEETLKKVVPATPSKPHNSFFEWIENEPPN
ncbi:MAG: hypothetical protein A2161_19055 [Candidatus Schekmanbacteria bacterium RBG_13_48_7]|uniref:AAA+ ATPase domain-containing protein n=1 Tax=Candidatus Schekmanbacteria bacterium RBG_13_48_7 TaxID=1817878 RepID=A0A1F7RR75_9BACT|nr:MAG: hypothetical protein A2161_19055 [Candidatus Schekmanbacteria bacterium RBG_13_48_7]